jgi:hypothetical protein
VFERASDWVNVFAQTFWLGTEVCHAKLLLSHNNAWYLTELTYDGVLFYKIEPDYEWYVIEDAVEVFSCDVVDSFYETVFNRAYTLSKLGLTWSNWYAVHAILNGKFPSLNCISYLSFLLFDHVQCDLPDKLRDLLDSMIDEEYHE